MACIADVMVVRTVFESTLNHTPHTYIYIYEYKMTDG